MDVCVVQTLMPNLVAMATTIGKHLVEPLAIAAPPRLLDRFRHLVLDAANEGDVSRMMRLQCSGYATQV